MARSSGQTVRSYRDLEALWLSKLQHAHTQYQQAAEQRRRMARELKQTLGPRSDGEFALANARKTESAALSAYKYTILSYKALAVNEIPPPDDEEQLL